MWCGQPPEGAFPIAPCCLFAAAIIAWAITALSALFFHGNAREPVETQRALTVGFVASVLIVVVHIAPDSVAMALAGAMAAHAALIAIVVAANFPGAQRSLAAPLQREQP